jgi:hypothetical protein
VARGIGRRHAGKKETREFHCVREASEEGEGFLPGQGQTSSVSSDSQEAQEGPSFVQGEKGLNSQSEGAGKLGRGPWTGTQVPRRILHSLDSPAALAWLAH